MRAVVLGILASLLLVGAASAQDADVSVTPLAPPPAEASDDATYDANFQCPETIADPDARIDEYASWTAWAKANHPDWNFKKRLDVRYGLLRRHACAVTLAAISNSEKAPFGP